MTEGIVGIVSIIFSESATVGVVGVSILTGVYKLIQGIMLIGNVILGKAIVDGIEFVGLGEGTLFFK